MNFIILKSNIKKNKLILLFSFSFILLYLIGIVFLSSYSNIGTNKAKDGDIGLEVYYEGCLEPTHHITKGKNILTTLIKEKYPEANTSYIILNGKTPYHLVNDPIEIGSFKVYGKVIGVKTEPCMNITVPVFEASCVSVKNVNLDKYFPLLLIEIILAPVLLIAIIIFVIKLIK